MSGTSGQNIAPLFNIGSTITAQVLGLPYQQYRPTTAFNPTASGNLIGSPPCWITADAQGKGDKQQRFGVPIWYGMFDPTVVAQSDYLIGPLGTFWVATLNPPLPMICVECNHTLNIARPASNTGVGAQPYGGDIRANETPIMTAWPASLLQGTKGEHGETELVGDVRMPWFNVLIPYGGVEILTADVLTDENNLRYKISSVEVTSLGMRLTAMLAAT